MADYNSSLTAQEIEDTLLGAVVHNKRMILTDVQKAQARDNIGAGSADNSFVVLGYFTTLEELIAAVPEPKAGPFYGVGETEPYDFYSWDELHSIWVNNGHLKGMDGKDAEGATVVVSPDAPENPETGDMWYDSDDEAVLPIDNAPLENSANLITSGAVFEALSGKISITKLWVNPDTTAEFAATTIALGAVSEYTFFILEYQMTTSNARRFFSIGVPERYSDAQGMSSIESETYAIYYWTRRWQVSASGDFIIQDAATRQSTSIINPHNNTAIPCALYGVKGVQ